jgi:hypothetical protein
MTGYGLNRLRRRIDALAAHPAFEDCPVCRPPDDPAWRGFDGFADLPAAAEFVRINRAAHERATAAGDWPCPACGRSPRSPGFAALVRWMDDEGLEAVEAVLVKLVGDAPGHTALVGFRTLRGERR